MIDVKLDAILARCEHYGECLLWTGATTGKRGTPRLWRDGKPHSGRSIVYELSRGLPMQNNCRPGTKCGERLCLNPEHLVKLTRGDLLKTAFDRAGGMRRSHVAACTASARRRENNKLTMDAAKAIRESDGSCSTLSVRYGVHKSLISKIRRGEAWCETTRGASVFSL